MFNFHLSDGFQALLPRPFNCRLRNLNAIELLQQTVQQVVISNHQAPPVAPTISSIMHHGEGNLSNRANESQGEMVREVAPSSLSPPVSQSSSSSSFDSSSTYARRTNGSSEPVESARQRAHRSYDEYTIVTDPLNDRFYIERLFNRRKTLLDLSYRVFLYNTTDERHRRECNNFVLNCPFVRDGPHRSIRLNLAASTILLVLTENGFTLERRPRSNSFLPPLGSQEERDLTACSTYVVCRFCRVSLFNVHLLNLVLAHRTNAIFALLERNARMMRQGTFSIVDLYALYSEQTNVSVRTKMTKFLRKSHRTNCVYLDRAFNQELIFDAMSANRMLNSQLANRCETCLVSLIEHDVNCSMQLEDILNSYSNAIEETERTVREEEVEEEQGEQQLSTNETNEDQTDRETTDVEQSSSDRTFPTTQPLSSYVEISNGEQTARPSVLPTTNENGDNDPSLLLACKCCLSKQARVNVPCGHLFQCYNCEKLLRRSNQTPFKNAPCPVCRSPVLMTSEIFL